MLFPNLLFQKKQIIKIIFEESLKKTKRKLSLALKINYFAHLNGIAIKKTRVSRPGFL